MKILFLISLLISVNGFSQKDRLPPPPPSNYDDYEKSAACVYKFSYSKNDFSFLFPFNKTSVIKLVSFKTQNESSGRIIQRYGHVEANDKWIEDSVRIDTSNWFEVKQLPEDEYFSLVDILYNYKFKREPKYSIETMCYIPRNAIIFYDIYMKIIGIIEICFECERMKTFPEELNLGDNCIIKMAILKNFFRSKGIKYGVIENGN